ASPAGTTVPQSSLSHRRYWCAVTAAGCHRRRLRASCRARPRCSARWTWPGTRPEDGRSSSSGHRTPRCCAVSGDPDAPLVAVADHSRPLLDAARTVLETPGLPRVVLIGGLAVTIRVMEAGAAHRATADVDLVTDATEPTALEVLADAFHTD